METLRYRKTYPVLPRSNFQMASFEEVRISYINDGVSPKSESKLIIWYDILS